MVKSQGTPSTSRHSERLGLDNRIVDEATRRHRMKKRLDALEKDNYQDDPHANIVWNKSIPKFADELVYTGGDAAGDGIGAKAKKRKSVHDASVNSGESATKKGKKLRAEFAKTRFRKTFAQLVEDEELRVKSEEPDVPTYAQIRAPPSRQPARKFCAVCGFFSKYNCVQCASRYCSIRCKEVHVDTRCLRWTS